MVGEFPPSPRFGGVSDGAEEREDGNEDTMAVPRQSRSRKYICTALLSLTFITVGATLTSVLVFSLPDGSASLLGGSMS